MSDPELAERLKRLEARISEAKAAQEPTPPAPDHHSQAHIAWRMVTELVAGLGIGFGIGYGLDAVFGTRPIMLVLFILLGFAAGVRVMLRTAAELQPKTTDRASGDGAEGNRNNG